MYLFTKLFWNNFFHDPKEVINTLQTRKSIWIHTFRFLIFIRVIISEYLLNNCFSRASALAYVLLLTLIPLVVSAAFMLTSLVEVSSIQIEKMFSFLLPFAPPTVLNHLSTFFENAHKLRGIGIGVLIFMTVGLFGTVEGSLNTIWKVTRSRSFFSRLRTFTMVIVYSPILFIASFQLRHNFKINFPDLSLMTSIIPFILIVLGFTSLIFFVPNTKVKFWSSFLGGMVAGTLFEIERRMFSIYVELSLQMQTIYGAFGILTLFLISLYFVSLIILLGAQIAYVHQNLRPLLRAKKRWDRRVGDYRTYITFRIVLDCVYLFSKKLPPPTLTSISKKYELTEFQALGLLKWLTHEGFLHHISSKEAYVPTRDFANTPVREVINAIEDQSRKIPTSPNDFIKTYVASLINKNREQVTLSDDQQTFAAIINQIDIEKQRAAKMAAAVAL
jgi:membrane protein